MKIEKKKFKITTIRLEIELIELLKQEARNNNVSLNKVVDVILKKELNFQKDETML